MYEAKLKELGIELPLAAKPLAAYIPAIQTGAYVYTSGQVPVADGVLQYAGKLGTDLQVEEGYEAAKLCALNCLAAIKSVIGSLDRIEQIVKLTGFVNSAADFSMQPQVVNGASEFLAQVFGEAAAHARSAVGVSGLPINSAVEIEMIVKLRD